MDDVERDSSITINVGYGNITFSREEGDAFASAIIDLCIGSPCGEDRIELALKIPAAPETETIATIVERSRVRIATVLRQAAAHFEAETAESLLYPSNASR